MEQRSEKSTVLIVDDDELVKNILIDELSQEYDIISAGNGQEALDKLEEYGEKIEVIVLDLVMPVMDGVTFLENYRNRKEYQKIPVIVATSREDIELEKKCLEYGVWHFVMKPYNPTLLRFRIKNAVAKSKLLVSDKDSVTGIDTKFTFYEKLRRLLAEVPDEKFAFVRMDIDRFKMINNFYGIAEGDRVLKCVAKELTRISEVFEHFLYARMENDVFVCCLPYKEENIELMVNALQISLKKLNKDYNIKMSCGVYVIDDYSLDVTQMYDRAYLAAKRCKENFSKRVVYYNNSMVESMRREQFVINEVNKALEEEQFVLYLQPKVNMILGRPYGAEALVRWIHPKHGMISPGEFIPVFEKNGIIGRLDQYVWRKACQLLRKWIDEGKEPDPISVNVSRVDIYNPHLVETLSKLVTEYRISPHLLNLELTESAFVEDQELVIKTMKRLRDYGFQIMMDDFGSGYSSLNILKDMEIDYLKIDMKFLNQDIGFNGKGEKVLTSVVKMAKWMHLPSIVEGVETQAQVDFLKDIGCEYVQGYYYAKPMPVEEYEKYIEQEHKKETKSLVHANIGVMNELWNPRSATSVLFDMLDVPIAVYEYKDDKIGLLRYNKLYEERIMTGDGEIIEEESEELRTAFDELEAGSQGTVIEILRDSDKWYRLTIKRIGKKSGVAINMVTFFDISDCK